MNVKKTKNPYLVSLLNVEHILHPDYMRHLVRDIAEFGEQGNLHGRAVAGLHSFHGISFAWNRSIFWKVLMHYENIFLNFLNDRFFIFDFFSYFCFFKFLFFLLFWFFTFLILLTMIIVKHRKERFASENLFKKSVYLFCLSFLLSVYLMC